MRTVLKLLGVICVTAVAGFLAHWTGGKGIGNAAPLLAVLGSVSFFFAEQLADVVWVSHGLTTTYSPGIAFRILGVVFWIVAGLCLVYSR